MTSETLLFHLSDDMILKILLKLDGDPRHWACLACVCTKLSALIRSVCYKHRCVDSIPAVLADLLSHPITPAPHPLDPPPHWWASLHKLAVCCPGLLHAGALLENSDFGLERDIGPDHGFPLHPPPPTSAAATTPEPPPPTWSLFDDLYFDTVYDPSEAHLFPPSPSAAAGVRAGADPDGLKRARRICGPAQPHPASVRWDLSREQGNKLLASRFRGDCLYLCDWPGCVHVEEKRNYMLFRGIFKNFKRSRVWRTINDGHRSKLPLGCAFCPATGTYDLLAAFCLRRVFGYHDDGEPVVRAYVCENGHVAGAWTDRPMYA